jgi:hypothetical protein
MHFQGEVDVCFFKRVAYRQPTPGEILEALLQVFLRSRRERIDRVPDGRADKPIDRRDSRFAPALGRASKNERAARDPGRDIPDPPTHRLSGVRAIRKRKHRNLMDRGATLGAALP